MGFDLCVVGLILPKCAAERQYQIIGRHFRYSGKGKPCFGGKYIEFAHIAYAPFRIVRSQGLIEGGIAGRCMFSLTHEGSVEE